MREAICARQDSYADIERKASQSLMSAGLKPEYVTIRNAKNLQPAEPGDQQLVILMAAFMGTTRLIDNMQITLDQA